MTTPPPVAILAGGRGTRLGELVRETPKPLLDVAGEPFLFHQLRLLRAHDVHRVVLCVGYLGDRIETVVGPSRFGMEIAYSHDREPGTAAALRQALPLLGGEFLVVYGDSYLEIDYGDVVVARRASELPALMTVCRWPDGNADVHDGRVVKYAKGDAGLAWIDWGVQALTAESLDVSGDADLGAVQSALAARGLLAAYEVSRPFHEIGTPEALLETEQFLRTRQR